MKGLYSEYDLKVMKDAEDSLNPHLDRIDEIVAYSKQAGIQKVGIANCVSFMKEADALELLLQKEGFAVEKVHCKYGKVPFNELLEGYKGTSCNPAGQAAYLQEKETELNVMMGLCVGHDMLFNQKSAAPVTPLVVKDRKLKHHTLEKLKAENKS